MKNRSIYFILIIMWLIVGCQSYDEYTSIYGSNYSNEPFVDLINYTIDEPDELVKDIMSCIICIDTDTIRFQQMQNINQKLIAGMSDQAIIAKTKAVINNAKYRNYIKWSIIEDMTFVTITSLPLYSIKIPKTTIKSNVVLYGITEIAPEYEIKFVTYTGQRYVVVQEGNYHFGFEHCVDKHSVNKYLKKNIKPDINTSFFINGNPENVELLLKSFIEDKSKTYIAKSGNTVLTGTTKQSFIKRKYLMVITPENELVSFFPKGKLTYREVLMVKKTNRKNKKCRAYFALRSKYKNRKS